MVSTAPRNVASDHEERLDRGGRVGRTPAWVFDAFNLHFSGYATFSFPAYSAARPLRSARRSCGPC